MEKVTALESEIKSLKDFIKKCIAEKTALDQMYTAQVKENLQLRTHCILLQEQINKPDVENTEEVTNVDSSEKPHLVEEVD